MSSAFCWKTFSRRIRSIARLRAVVTIQAPGVAGSPVARPALECRRERVLHGVLGELEVAEDAREDRDGTRPLLSEDALDVRAACRRYCRIGRISIEPVSFAAGIERREPDRLVEIGQVDDEDAAEDLLRLRERAVRDDALAVAHANDLRGVAAVELLPGHVRVGLAELLEEREPLRHLLRAELRPLLVGKVDPRRVVVVDEHRVLHSCDLLGIDVDRPDLDRAVLGAGDARGPVERLVHRVALEDEEAAERLLHLGVRAVGHERLVVADANRRRVARRRELVPAGEHACCLRVACERAVALVPGFALLVRERRPRLLVRVDQRHVLHASSFASLRTR